MNLRSLGKNELVGNLKTLVHEERRITVEILEHLHEVERRNLHAEYQCSSLWDFAIKELGYSEGAAGRRISAMRLLRDVPEAKAQIENGDLSLSVAASLQSFCQKQNVKGRDKRALADELKHSSSREAQELFATLAPNAVPRELVRPIGEDLVESKIIMSKKLRAKLDRLKGCLSHVNPAMSDAELIERLADLGLEKYDPIKRDERRSRRKATSTSESQSEKLTQAQKDRVHARDKDCVHMHEGVRCHSTHLLEVDHIIPPNFGGTNDLSNLRLLCDTHNRLAAEKWYGKEKMAQYRGRLQERRLAYVA